jgi:hypothetical protein
LLNQPFQAGCKVATIMVLSCGGQPTELQYATHACLDVTRRRSRHFRLPVAFGANDRQAVQP